MAYRPPNHPRDEEDESIDLIGWRRWRVMVSGGSLAAIVFFAVVGTRWYDKNFDPPGAKIDISQPTILAKLDEVESVIKQTSGGMMSRYDFRNWSHSLREANKDVAHVDGAVGLIVPVVDSTSSLHTSVSISP